MSGPEQGYAFFYVELGRRIRAAREAAGLTQADLAERIGLTRASVTNIEAGRQRAQVHLLVFIAFALGVAAQSLLRPDIIPLAAHVTEAMSGDAGEDADDGEVFGHFTIYPPGTGGNGWGLSFGGAWLPGRYADRDAALFACGYVLGGETRGYIDHVRDRVSGLITLADLAGLKKPQAAGD